MQDKTLKIEFVSGDAQFEIQWNQDQGKYFFTAQGSDIDGFTYEEFVEIIDDLLNLKERTEQKSIPNKDKE
jgi:hypothetical protein